MWDLADKILQVKRKHKPKTATQRKNRREREKAARKAFAESKANKDFFCPWCIGWSCLNANGVVLHVFVLQSFTAWHNLIFFSGSENKHCLDEPLSSTRRKNLITLDQDALARAIRQLSRPNHLPVIQ